jgi:phospholipid/cholesterol/gamma-HCH transport system ATP-binding protein
MIEFEGVVKRFGSQDVLRGVTFTVARGEAVALLGPSGVGKTVLLKMVIGLLDPDGGDVRVDGVSIPQASDAALALIRRRVGYVFQSSALFDSLTVAENVLLGLDDAPSLAEAEVRRRRVDERLRWVNLDPSVAELYPRQLSGGMQKRVAVARAVIGEQRYLLYDEPTAGLDPGNASVVAELICRLRHQVGVTSIVVTHDIGLARRVCNRFVMVYDGVIHAQGPMHALEGTPDPVILSYIRGPGALEAVG